ncbi:MAG: peptidoglycan editing factor PgeF [Gammaproteobacteria bacterium]|nr:peptidoglycan editing factor PgeF [Gammaproteobacteria bacterium]
MVNKTLNQDWITPLWPAPKNVRAVSTTRQLAEPATSLYANGYANGYANFNLATHVGDDASSVQNNRAILRNTLNLPNEPVWLNQVHGTDIVYLRDTSSGDAATMLTTPPAADATISQTQQAVAVVMTADCLPVLLCDQAGTVVAAVHAGWRGLVNGVLQATVQGMNVPAEQLLAWLGPGIGAAVYEVGEDVRQTFCAADPAYAAMFKVSPARPTHYLLDMVGAARLALQSVGVYQLYGGEYCTYQESQRFYSYRRDGVTGRMASLIWLS